MLLNIINVKYKKIINEKDFEKTKFLLIENSKKINSNRKKIYKCNYKNDYNQSSIKIEGLITNIENVELLYVNSYINNINKEILSLQIYNNKYTNENGYLYIIKEREFIKTNEEIYKIGCTNDIIRRFKQYPKNSIIIYYMIHNDYKNIEKN